MTSWTDPYTASAQYATQAATDAGKRRRAVKNAEIISGATPGDVLDASVKGPVGGGEADGSTSTSPIVGRLDDIGAETLLVIPYMDDACAGTAGEAAITGCPG